MSISAVVFGVEMTCAVCLNQSYMTNARDSGGSCTGHCFAVYLSNVLDRQRYGVIMTLQRL